ncbi:MAG: dihydrolipoyl dehydrogenase [Calditrichaeota bacterium]|nr:MAG: dihydrolipoyl dehydrogenase [Calditrichota bacterium]
MKYDYDMVVIGGGAAGLTSAGVSVSLGAKTALVEAKKLGGDCTWYGCIPSKTLLKAAQVAHYFKTAHRYGLKSVNYTFNFAEVMAHVRRIQQQVYEDADAPEIYENLGVEVITARAAFIDPHTVELQASDGNQRQITSRYFIIATGSAPVVPPIPGLDQIRYLTNESIFSLTDLPQTLLVIGAGPIGLEVAQAFQRLGAQVVVVDIADGILLNDDRELADLLKIQLEAEGIQFFTSTQVERVENVQGKIRLFARQLSEAKTLTLEGDAVLLSVGRKPNVEGLNLEAAGVKYNKSGIAVNESCRTNVKHIYACGDVTGRFQFTHFAEHMAKVAVSNALLHFPMKLDNRHITWCTYTDPELAHVGLTEKQLQEKGVKYEIYRFPFSKIDRAITDNETVGWVKVFARKLTGKIYGVNILGGHAGEMIGEYALAMRHGITLKKISDTIHPYPTYVLGNRRAADQWYVRKQSRTLVWLLQKVFGYRGPLPDTSDPERIV